MSPYLAAGLPIPDMAKVLGFGAEHLPARWEPHRQHAADCAALAVVLAVAQACARFTRSQVFDIAREDTAAGAIAALVWGFPNGGPRGQSKGFICAFNAIERYADIIDAAKRKRMGAKEILYALNNVTKGVGFASTTKMMYFAGLVACEGKALIFDSNVIEAIRDADGPWSIHFPETKAALGNTRHWYSRGPNAYSFFVHEAQKLADALTESGNSVCPSQLETALFLAKVRNPRWR